MGRSNGNKAQQKRERNAKKAAGKGGKSQLKKNTKAQNIVCKICYASFLCTANRKVLETHSNSKHPKADFKDCFPGSE